MSRKRSGKDKIVLEGYFAFPTKCLSEYEKIRWSSLVFLKFIDIIHSCMYIWRPITQNQHKQYFGAMAFYNFADLGIDTKNKLWKHTW